MTDVGILGISSGDYHADTVADIPTLSASIAHLLCTRSPAHARAAHPRLNPDYKREERQIYDVGTAAHAMLLEGRDAVQVVDAADWRTKSAREERDEARALGRIPLLCDTYDEVLQMLNAASAQLAAHGAVPPLFGDGVPEQTLVWEEDGVICRARPDWLRDDRATIDDLKTTSKSAHPAAYARALFNVGGDVQAAFYLRGLRAVNGSLRSADFRWAVIETAPPYALAVIAPAPDVLALGDRKVEYALNLWRHCLETDTWPAYPTEVCWANAPEYEMARWLEREAIEEAA